MSVNELRSRFKGFLCNICESDCEVGVQYRASKPLLIILTTLAPSNLPHIGLSHYKNTNKNITANFLMLKRIWLSKWLGGQTWWWTCWKCLFFFFLHLLFSFWADSQSSANLTTTSGALKNCPHRREQPPGSTPDPSDPSFLASVSPLWQLHRER